LRWLITGGAFVFFMARLWVAATVLCTALSGFVAVAAVACCALWGGLSGLLCASLSFTVGAWRIGDMVELVETGDEP
ncbi:mechanosensitive ion channel family protein, partial [Pseudomonas syringae pv. tagetis]